MNQEIQEQIDALAVNAMEAKHIPGVTLAIVQDGKIAYTRAYGVRNLETQEPLRADALFHLASVTKLFVGTALMQLQERGLLDLDAPVVRYLPYFKLNDSRVNEITVRQMLTHTSGIPDTEEYGWENPEYDDGALERYVRSLANEALIAAPNEKYFYSNIAYEVLGDVIAKVSGLTFEEFVAQNILRPLKMDKSTLLVTEADPNLLATPHTVYPSKQGPPIVSSVFPYNRAHAPSSTLYSNVADLSRFARAYLNHGELEGTRILQAETVDEMWAPAFRKNGEYWPYIGLTWNIGERQGQRNVGHAGEDVGFSSMLLLAPERGVALIHLSNSDANLFDDAGDEIFDKVVFDEWD